MEYIAEGFREALRLIIGFDAELYGVILLSVSVSLRATVIATLISLPYSVYAGLRSFRGERIFARVLYSALSVPSVIVGLVVAIILSRRGPLGDLQLLYTPAAMIISQTVLILPLMTGLSYNLVKRRGRDIERLGRTLGARRFSLLLLVIAELRYDFIINVIAGFCRAISEVGSVMIVGGNIKGDTRVITTAIAMFNSMGNYSGAIALGIILLAVSFIINSIVYSYRGE